jgi:hypothetical protein|tara:strand:+ start:36020 stop:36283 length:264 start_codon:yes stop_codon:yes gene_type:complete
MNNKIEMLERLRLSYMTDKNNTMNVVNTMINNHSVFPVTEEKLKEQIDKLAVIEISIEQVSYFIDQLSQDNKDGNSTQGDHDDPTNN